LLNSFSSSLSVVYRLKPNTPKHLFGSGSSLFPWCRRLSDIGERESRLFFDLSWLLDLSLLGGSDLDLDLDLGLSLGAGLSLLPDLDLEAVVALL